MPINNDFCDIVRVDFPYSSLDTGLCNIHPELFESCRFIFLETNRESVIGSISDIEIFDTLIYILDQHITREVYIFTLCGDFVRKISRKGNGPNEYISVSDIFVDSRNKALNLVCNANRKVMVFNLLGDTLIRENRISASIMNIESSSDGLHVGYAANVSSKPKFRDNIFSLSENFLILSSGVPIDNTWESRHVGDTRRLSSFGNRILYCPQIEYAIFEICRDTIFLRYRYDFVGRSLPDKYRNPNDFTTGLNRLSDPVVTRIKYFQETSDYMITVFSIGSLQAINLFSKIDKTSITRFLHRNPFFFDFLPFGNVKKTTSSCIVTEISPRSIISLKNEFSANIRSWFTDKEATSVYSTKDGDNPIICIYEFAHN